MRAHSANLLGGWFALGEPNTLFINFINRIDIIQQMRKIFLISIIALLLFVACKTEAPSVNVPNTIEPNNQVREFKVLIEHTRYQPDKYVVRKGDTVRFLATSKVGQGGHNHGITIDEYNINEAVTTENLTSPKVIEFVADKVGIFRVYCKTCWDGPFGKNHPNIASTLEVQP